MCSNNAGHSGRVENCAVLPTARRLGLFRSRRPGAGEGVKEDVSSGNSYTSDWPVLMKINNLSKISPCAFCFGRRPDAASGNNYSNKRPCAFVTSSCGCRKVFCSNKNHALSVFRSFLRRPYRWDAISGTRRRGMARSRAVRRRGRAARRPDVLTDTRGRCGTGDCPRCGGLRYGRVTVRGCEGLTVR
jgi:hypothetical protein